MSKLSSALFTFTCKKYFHEYDKRLIYDHENNIYPEISTPDMFRLAAAEGELSLLQKLPIEFDLPLSTFFLLYETVLTSNKSILHETIRCNSIEIFDWLLNNEVLRKRLLDSMRVKMHQRYVVFLAARFGRFDFLDKLVSIIPIDADGEALKNLQITALYGAVCHEDEEKMAELAAHWGRPSALPPARLTGRLISDTISATLNSFNFQIFRRVTLRIGLASHTLAEFRFDQDFPAPSQKAIPFVQQLLESGYKLEFSDLIMNALVNNKIELLIFLLKAIPSNQAAKLDPLVYIQFHFNRPSQTLIFNTFLANLPPSTPPFNEIDERRLPRCSPAGLDYLSTLPFFPQPRGTFPDASYQAPRKTGTIAWLEKRGFKYRSGKNLQHLSMIEDDPEFFFDRCSDLLPPTPISSLDSDSDLQPISYRPDQEILPSLILQNKSSKIALELRRRGVRFQPQIITALIARTDRPAFALEALRFALFHGMFPDKDLPKRIFFGILREDDLLFWSEIRTLFLRFADRIEGLDLDDLR